MLIGCHILTLATTYLLSLICTQTNTFQCVLITDGTNSFVIFLYADNLIQWSLGNAQAGFNAGDGEFHFTISGSQTPAIVDIETTSNIGVPGKYLFRVDNARKELDHNRVKLLFYPLNVAFLYSTHKRESTNRRKSWRCSLPAWRVTPVHLYCHWPPSSFHLLAERWLGALCWCKV